MTGVWARLDELLGRRVSMRALTLLRIAVGPIVLVHLQPFLEAAADGTIYRDTFHEPYLSWYPELPRELYVALLLVAAGAAVTTSLGLFTRASTIVLFGTVTYNVFLSTLHFRHNRAYLMIALAVLAIVPCGRELSIDAWRRRRRRLPRPDLRSPAWPLWLLRFEASVIYLASGFSKLIDPDWVSGVVIWDRIVQVEQRIIDESPLPMWTVDVLTDRTFHSVVSPLLVAIELAIGLGFWSRRTRYGALWLAVVFHVAIQVSAQVQVFSWLALAALVIWAVPSTRDRTIVLDPSTTSGRRALLAVRWLDWLARFRVETVADGGPVRMIDRDGTELRGRPAHVVVASRLLPIAWFALPLLLLPSVRRARRRAEPAMAVA